MTQPKPPNPKPWEAQAQKAAAGIRGPPKAGVPGFRPLIYSEVSMRPRTHPKNFCCLGYFFAVGLKYQPNLPARALMQALVAH